jgi:hypothetical protein
MADDIARRNEIAKFVAVTLAEAIQSLGRVPSGELYAQVMGHLTLEQYNAAISVLKFGKMVQEKNHELIWIGPAKR